MSVVLEQNNCICGVLISPTAKRCKKCYIEELKKYNASRKGVPVSEKEAERLRTINIGRTHSKETIDKMIKARTGLKRSEVTKQKMRESAIAYAKANPIAKEDHPWFGRQHTEQSKELNRKAHEGKIASFETRKKMSEAHAGEKHHNYIDGRSFFPYPQEFTNILKEEIRTRDSFECQGENCDLTNEEHLLIYNQSLHVHHIDYDKFNCSKNNLISTCLQCNLKANFNRSYWQEFYSAKVKES